MNKSPAFQFYPKDFLMDDKVAVMNMEARGVYITLLSYCWNNNGLPNDQEELKQMCGHLKNWENIWKKVGKCFYVNSGKLYNKRLDKELRKQEEWKEKSRKGGKRTQQERWSGASKKKRAERMREARKKGTHTSLEWEIMQEICGHKCVRCGIEQSRLHGGVLCKDHIIPICFNGSDSIKNIQPFCKNCNSAKANEQIDHRPKNWKALFNQSLTNRQPMPNSPVSSLQSSSSLKDIYTPQFKKFWAEYPNKKEKDAAFEVFERLKEKEKQQTVVAARNYRIQTEREKQEKRFIKHPVTFLRKNRWRDYLGSPEKEEMEKFDEMQEKAMEEGK